jgi:hypothetical protein
MVPGAGASRRPSASSSSSTPPRATPPGGRRGGASSAQTRSPTPMRAAVSGDGVRARARSSRRPGSPRGRARPETTCSASRLAGIVLLTRPPLATPSAQALLCEDTQIFTKGYFIGWQVRVFLRPQSMRWRAPPLAMCRGPQAKRRADVRILGVSQVMKKNKPERERRERGGLRAPHSGQREISTRRASKGTHRGREGWRGVWTPLPWQKQ